MSIRMNIKSKAPQNIIKFCILLLILCGSTNSYAQKILMTDSGQKVLISKSGNWSIVKFDQKVDENGNIVPDNSTSLDAFQAPNAGKYPLTIDQKSTVDNMLKAFLSDEAQLLVNTVFFKDNIESLKLKKKKAKENNEEANQSMRK